MTIHLTTISCPNRSGSALLIAVLVVTTLASMAISLTSLSIGCFNEQKQRMNQVVLLASAESAANEAVAWMQNNAALLKPGALNVCTTLYPTTSPWPSSFTLTPKLTVVFGNLGSIPNNANFRNGCRVRAEIVKVVDTVGGLANWPDGKEKFIVYATAEAGVDVNGTIIDRNNYRRQRIDAVVTTSSGSSIFNRALYARNSYSVTGAMSTDSWSSATGPYSAAGAGNRGDIASGGTIVSSQGNPSVSGQIIQNDVKSLPVYTYNPPIAQTSASALSGSQTWNPGGTNLNLRYPSVNMGNNQVITISGSGTISLYCDGPLNLKDIKYAAGSTANLIIYQNDYTIATASSFNFNGNATMGDPASPKRLLLISNYSGAIALNGGANFYGVIFAPFADINMNGNFGMFGAIVAEGFGGRINGNFAEHYDTTLASMRLPLDPRLTVIAWAPHVLAFGQP